MVEPSALIAFLSFAVRLAPNYRRQQRQFTEDGPRSVTFLTLLLWGASFGAKVR